MSASHVPSLSMMIGPERRQTIALPQVDDTSSIPRFVQAKAILTAAIRDGTFTPGSKLPNTSEIGARLHVSLITAHKAIQELVREGWLRRERGRGTFVRGDFEASVAAKPKFRIALILRPATVLLDFYHGVLLASLRHAAETTEETGELVLQRCPEMEDINRIDADGFLVFHPSLDCFRQIEQAESNRPLVVLGGSTRDTHLYCVDAQNYEGARRAVRHLIESGHRRIAIVNGPLTATNCLDRYAGYKAELAAHGIQPREDYHFTASAARSAGTALAQLGRVLRSAERPTAILACGYYLALDVMMLLRRMWLRIPDDVSLVGFDDPKSACLLNPALTTVAQPLEDMGALAYERIVQLIKGKRWEPRVELLPTSLIIRDSTGPID
jgi:DNA-binding LacI/PurR family transcriptional regulator/DNA-binding transcriptional regulator YhcF (GntR family)